MKEFSVSGQKRATTGKKAAKELRKEGLVPCNLYGEKTPRGHCFCNPRYPAS